MPDIITPVAMEVTGTREFNDWERCLDTFGNRVFLCTSLDMYKFVGQNGVMFSNHVNMITFNTVMFSN